MSESDSIKEYLSKIGKKGGAASGAQRKGDSKKMRELVKKRWAKKSKKST